MHLLFPLFLLQQHSAPETVPAESGTKRISRAAASELALQGSDSVEPAGGICNSGPRYRLENHSGRLQLLNTQCHSCTATGKQKDADPEGNMIPGILQVLPVNQKISGALYIREACAFGGSKFRLRGEAGTY